MKKETYEQQRAFAGEKKASMKRRCVGHDYTRPGIYMLTMVVEGRRPLFGRVYGTRITRHSTASRMLRNGVPLPVISDMLGHKNKNSVMIISRLSAKDTDGVMKPEGVFR